MFAASVCDTARIPSNDARRVKADRRSITCSTRSSSSDGTTQSPTATSAPMLRTRSGSAAPRASSIDRMTVLQPRSSRDTRPGAPGDPIDRQLSSKSTAQPRAGSGSSIGVVIVIRTVPAMQMPHSSGTLSLTSPRRSPSERHRCPNPSSSSSRPPRPRRCRSSSAAPTTCAPRSATSPTCPSKGLNIDVDNGFKPTYELTERGKTVVKDLRAALKDASRAVPRDGRGPRGRGHLAGTCSSTSSRRCR